VHTKAATIGMLIDRPGEHASPFLSGKNGPTITTFITVELTGGVLAAEALKVVREWSK
jgi:hypothetical protein